ncbi:hypothetical protein BpHYR1_018220 [Brachionus plicatilis]|uniref:Uncharacterized protein n=1 Tax=Brachionus plicatilis TaxID=10195 RepID=A0A3M7Q2P1_BRAPC|nr:hypothetical protein BpHYR1_018220 [Brachionus plicatilis]
MCHANKWVTKARINKGIFYFTCQSYTKGMTNGIAFFFLPKLMSPKSFETCKKDQKLIYVNFI